MSYQFCECGMNKVLAGYTCREVSNPNQPIHISYSPITLYISNIDYGRNVTVLSDDSRCPDCDAQLLANDFESLPESY